MIEPGRKASRLRRAGWFAVMAVAFLLAAVLAFVLVYDIAISRWIDVPLDVLFLAGSAGGGFWALRRYERAAFSRKP